MKKNYDEPMFTDVIRCEKDCPTAKVEAEIRLLCAEQSFAVLATQGDGQPYASLIAFATSEDLTKLIFATPVMTRKYQLISANNQVSALIDNRSNHPDSINLISGLTMTGRARILEDPDERGRWATVLLQKHEYLRDFVRSGTSGLILVEAVRYFYVRRFQEVFQWIPGNRS